MLKYKTLNGLNPFYNRIEFKFRVYFKDEMI